MSTTVVLLPDGTTKKATYVGDSFVICQDGTSYLWNEYDSINSTVSVIDVNSMTANQNIPKENIGIISSVSFNIDDETYDTNKDGSNVIAYGGSGEGATFSIDTVEFNQYALTGFSVYSGGQDYISGDNIFIKPLNSLTVVDVTSITRNTITDYDVNITNSSLHTEIANFSHPTGGNGSGAIFGINFKKTVTYLASSATIVNAGENYNTNDELTVGSTCVINVDSVDYGNKGITKITMTPPDTLYESENNNIVSSYDQSGSGTGATFNLTYNKLYVPDIVTLNNGGYGYKVGDVLKIGDIATITVTGTTSSDDTILSYTTLVSPDLDLSTESVATFSAEGGSGYGATFKISILNTDTYSILGTTILYGGSGYKVGDALSIKNVLTATVATISNGGIATITSSAIPYSFVSIPDTSLTYSTSNTAATGYEIKPLVTSVQLNIINYPDTLVISDAGTGYSVGDTLYFEGGVNIGYITVENVSSGGAITSINTVFLGNPLPSGQTVYSLTGGTGSGATCSITYDTHNQENTFQITGFTIIKQGSGFVAGDIIDVTYNGNVLCQVTVVTTLSSTITGITYDEDGTYSTTDFAGTYKLSGGSGTGATIEISTTETTQIILDSIAMINSGYGYKLNDTLTLGKYATITVTAVSDDPKTITSVSSVINKTPSTSDMAAQNLVASGGSGIEATFDITSEAVYTVASSTLASPGTGYNVGDYIIASGYYDAATKTTFSDGGYGNVEAIELSTQPAKSLSIKSANYVSSEPENPVTPTGGTGTGLTANLSYRAVDTYDINSVDLGYGGFSYHVGDVLDLGSDIGTVSVKAVGDLGGSISSLAANINTDTSYSKTDISGIYEASGGSGAGLKVLVSYAPVPFFKISAIEMVSGGYGYKLGDILYANGKSITVTGIKNIISNE